MTLLINANPRTLKRAVRGPMTGDIWITLGRESFPSPRWNDFVVVILCAWANSVLRIVRGESARERVLFMEGPYRVEIETYERGMVHLRATAHPNKTVAHADVSAKTLLENILEVGDSTLRAARELGDDSLDAVQLARALEELRLAEQAYLLKRK